jgi:hypothetical protein
MIWAADEREGVGMLAQRPPADGEIGADRGVDLLNGDHPTHH